jgi:hypothetical protein
LVPKFFNLFFVCGRNLNLDSISCAYGKLYVLLYVITPGDL